MLLTFCFAFLLLSVRGAMVSKNSKCTIRNVDLFFVVDGSGSVSASDFGLAMQFVKETVQAMEIGPAASQIGFVQFSHFPKMEFKLNSFIAKPDVLQNIGLIRQQGGGTAIGKAMNLALTDGFSKAAGNRSEYPDVMIVITDGQDSGAVKYVARVAETRGVKTFAIGIGTAPSLRQLLEIANGHQERVSRFKTFRELVTSIDAICKPIMAAVEPSTTTTAATPTSTKTAPTTESTSPTTSSTPSSTATSKPTTSAPPPSTASPPTTAEEEQCCTILITNYQNYPKFNPCDAMDPNSCTTDEVCLPVCVPM